jgi:heme/copper-type cytochrome/quinol oxidase subunit 2
MIAIPSFQLLTAQYTPDEEPKLTIKATGNQWNWDYEYQIEAPLSFNSALLADGDREGAGKPISHVIRACLPSTMSWLCRSIRRRAFWLPPPTSCTLSRCRLSA